jgi:HAD superfamily hydrolase (TIGR01509 family)
MPSALPPSASFDAVIFDCDGVLADSEGITNRVLAEMVQLLGCPLSLQEVRRRFTGVPMAEVVKILQAKLGHDLPTIWHSQFHARRAEAFRRELRAIPGVQLLLQALATAGVPVAVASGAERDKVLANLKIIGLDGHFGPQVFTGSDVAHRKPAPDVYLLAAKSLGVDPARCAVVEDSATGVRAGVAAGMTVFGYVADGAGDGVPDELRAAGAFALAGSMHRVGELLGLGLTVA